MTGEVRWSLVHVTECPQGHTLLPNSRNQMLCRCGLTQVQTNSETGRLLLQQIVERTGWAQWSGIESDRRGKPRLRGVQGVDFSISHSGDWTLVAVARGCKVGADLELVTPVFGSPSLIKRSCSATEAAGLYTLPAEIRNAALADLWTAKEAAVKADGAGLAIDLRTVDSSRIPILRLRKGIFGLSACIVRLPAGIHHLSELCQKVTIPHTVYPST